MAGTLKNQLIVHPDGKESLRFILSSGKTEEYAVQKDGIPRPLVPYKEYVVRVNRKRVLVLEFSFAAQREMLGPLKHIDGRAIHPDKGEPEKMPYILLNSDVVPEDKREWALRHEKKHIERFMVGKEIKDEDWDEFEVELLVLAEYPAKRLRPKNYWISHPEILRTLYRYLQSEDPELSARELINFLKEKTDANYEEVEEPKKSSDLPQPGV